MMMISTAALCSVSIYLISLSQHDSIKCMCPGSKLWQEKNAQFVHVYTNIQMSSPPR